MGWKSTIDLTREEAIAELVKQMGTLNDKSNSEIEEMLYSYGFGDDGRLKWYGHNFNITD